MTIADELAAALTAQHAAESLCRDWEREAMHSLAGLVATPAEGYGVAGTGPGQFKADARRLRDRVAELEDMVKSLNNHLAAQAEFHRRSERAEKEVITEAAPLPRPVFDQLGNRIR